MKALLAVLIFALVTSAAHSSENQATSNGVFSWTSGYIGMNVGRSGGAHARLIYSATGKPFVYDTGSFASGKIKTQHTYNKNWDDDYPGPTVAFSTARN